MLALSTQMSSYEGPGGRGFEGKLLGLQLWEQAQASFWSSWNSGWIDSGLAKAAFVSRPSVSKDTSHAPLTFFLHQLMALYEVNAHPLHSHARIISSMLFGLFLSPSCTLGFPLTLSLSASSTTSFALLPSPPSMLPTRTRPSTCTMRFPLSQALGSSRPCSLTPSSVYMLSRTRPSVRSGRSVRGGPNLVLRHHRRWRRSRRKSQGGSHGAPRLSPRASRCAFTISTFGRWICTFDFLSMSCGGLADFVRTRSVKAHRRP